MKLELHEESARCACPDSLISNDALKEKVEAGDTVLLNQLTSSSCGSLNLKSL